MHTYKLHSVQLMKVNAEVWPKVTKGLFLIAIYAERNISKDAEGLLLEEFSMFNSTFWKKYADIYLVGRPILKYFWNELKKEILTDSC